MSVVYFRHIFFRHWTLNGCSTGIGYLSIGILYPSDSQPGCRGTQVCCERSSGVPRKINQFHFVRKVMLINHKYIFLSVYASDGWKNERQMLIILYGSLLSFTQQNRSWFCGQIKIRPPDFTLSKSICVNWAEMGILLFILFVTILFAVQFFPSKMGALAHWRLGNTALSWAAGHLEF